jgi:hypothetical protein
VRTSRSLRIHRKIRKVSNSPNKRTKKEAIYNIPAIWHCLRPCKPSHSARTFVMGCGGNATGNGNSALYRDIVVICYIFDGRRVQVGQRKDMEEKGKTDEILGYGDFHRFRIDAKHRDDLAHAVGAVVEEEKRIIVCKHRSRRVGHQAGRCLRCGAPLIRPSSPPMMIGFKNSSVISSLYFSSTLDMASGASLAFNEPSGVLVLVRPSTAILTRSHRLSRSIA